ncbi:M20/M25/M40 family metallo-hydrolase, partial [Oleiphilus sp. HI0043]|uniref:M20/M25/M40 family metallo-hydrolase n=3 Tax=Oleiphilus TaxID=141450 RepID=UPI000A718545
MSDTTTDTIQLSQALIQQPSVTPEDCECQDIMMRHLAPLGFKAETMIFEDVTNLWARKGNEAPLIAFAGHTDVVPTGPEQEWTYSPFSARIQGDMLHGRGAADMKGSLAAFITACERFVKKHPDHKGSIAYLITSDEEGPATNGTVKVVETLEARNEKIDWCLVGEPSSTKVLGDVIK